MSSGISPCASLISLGSIAPVATRWHDCDECIEVEINNGLKGLAVALSRRLSGSASCQAAYSARAATNPATVLYERCDLVRLSAGRLITDLGERLLDLTTGAISSLSFGVAEGAG